MSREFEMSEEELEELLDKEATAIIERMDSQGKKPWLAESVGWCFLDKERACAGDCMAFVKLEEGDTTSNCLLLRGPIPVLPAVVGLGWEQGETSQGGESHSSVKIDWPRQLDGEVAGTATLQDVLNAVNSLTRAVSDLMTVLSNAQHPYR